MEGIEGKKQMQEETKLRQKISFSAFRVCLTVEAGIGRKQIDFF